MATPNETSDLITRIQQAKDFLKEHLEETIATASRIFKIATRTIRRHGGARIQLRAGLVQL
jgi:hypothetical protein